MDLTVLTLSWLLLAQTAVEAPLVPIRSGEGRASAADLVARALTPPPDAPLAGEPLTLVTALSTARRTGQQLDVTHAYWRLTMAVAEYRLALDADLHLRAIQARREDAATFQTALQSAAAALRMAELAAVAAQHDLAEAAGLPAASPLPLPADPPHLGTYRTYFDEVFSKRNPPDRARLIHRKLPIRRQAIEVRAMAVRAAQDAMEAAVDAYRLGTQDLPPVLWSLARWGEQYRALLTSACNYNHEIADYALAVAGPQSDPRVLVAMLIMPSEKSAAPPSAVRPATLDAPVPDSDADEPAALAPHGQLRSLGDQVPTLAPPEEVEEPEGVDQPPWTLPPDSPEEPAAGDSQPPGPASQDEPALPPLPEGPETAPPTDPSHPSPRASNRPALDDQADSAVLAFYPALAEVDAATRAELLCEELHAKRNLPEGLGEPVELGRCLAGVTAANRHGLIPAYWRVAQRSAECEALACQSNFLEDLVLTTFDRRHGPLGAEAMLDLRAAQLAVEADSLGAQLALLDAQFELTRHTDRPQDWPWLVPDTIPRSRRFSLNLEAQPRELAESWPVRRLSAVIPALAEALQQRATVAVDADTARAAATAAYRAGREGIVPVLDAIERQADETLVFLAALADYNQAIAEYALAVLPPTIPGDRLARVLLSD